jgi:hypothetical protein
MIYNESMNFKLNKYYLVVIVFAICIFDIMIYIFFSKQLEIYIVETMATQSNVNLNN